MLGSMRGRVRRFAAAACLAGAATAALVISAPASAGDAGACAGSLIESINANWLGQKYGELDVYYNAATGRNCAKMNHAGATWGKRVWTGVQLTICSQSRPGSGCNSIAGGVAQDFGDYSYYAGPVTPTASARGHCIAASGSVYIPGKGYGVGVATGVSHCGG
jgi:hypothetical protein